MAYVVFILLQLFSFGVGSDPGPAGMSLVELVLQEVDLVEASLRPCAMDLV